MLNKMALGHNKISLFKEYSKVINYLRSYILLESNV